MKQIIKNISSLETANFTDCDFNMGSQTLEPQFSYLLAFMFGIPATLIIIITVFGNFLVLCFKAKVGKRQTMLLIWNLGLADFLVGLFVLPVGVSYVIGQKWPFNRLLCRIWVSCDVIFCTASIVTLCVISVDRYIGVTRPLRYKLIVTKTKVVISIIAIWIFSISILLATIRYHSDDEECYNPNVCHAGNELEYVVHSVIFAFFLPTLVTLVLYWKIYKVAKRRERGLAQGLLLAMGQNFFKECFAIPLRIHCGKDAMSHQQQIIRMHKKVATTLGVVVSAFVLCWGPFFSLYLIGYKCGGCIPTLILDMTSWLGYCNSMINPVIYAFTVEEFKRSLKNVFCSLWYRRNSRNFSTPSEPVRTSNVHRPPTSTLPRSNRAYSLVATQEEIAASFILPFVKRQKPILSRENTDVAKRNAGLENTAKLFGRTSQRHGSTVSSMLQNGCTKRRHTTFDLARKRSQTDQEINEKLMPNEPLVPPPSLVNGVSADSVGRLEMDQFSRNKQPIWNAKLYCTLISPQTTGL